jgi:alcohol dehydrogenase class IV
MTRTADGEDLEPRSPLVVTRKGALDELPEVVERVGARRSLVVVGPGLGPVGERVTRLLGDRSTGLFTDAVAHVPSWEVNLAVASAQEVHADSVISVGGGSSAGYAKIVALALRLPWIAVPTTFSGAEMTSRYLVTTDRGKEAGSSPRSAARAVVRDPDVLDGVPRSVLASSGMSAVAACLEVLAGKAQAPRSAAEGGLRMLWETLPRLLDDPADVELRLRAFEGAALAGSALEAAGPGPAQLLAEDLGAWHRCDHGALMACLVPRTVRSLGVLDEITDSAAVVDFARSLGLPVELAEVCPPPDVETVLSRLAARPDIAEYVDLTALRLVLEEPA